jgi:misacylated tRNA(Ala) deacylase
MTEKLYWNDSYLKEFDAVVSGIDGNSVFLDRTAFYPTGGGQPSDTGTLVINGDKYLISEAKKEGNEIRHTSAGGFDAKIGDKANGIIDWERRYPIMRYHTALHLFYSVVEKNHSTALSRGNQMYENRARIDLDVQEMNREKAEELVDKANSVMSEGHEVHARIVGREEALKILSLAKTEPGRALINSLHSVRIVEIEGVDMQMDGGTHVRNTLEIGRIRLSGFENKGTNRKRIEFVLE